MIRPRHLTRHDPQHAHTHPDHELEFDAGPQVPLPSALWAQADEENPGDGDARHARYVELMIDAGHIEVDEPDED